MLTNLDICLDETQDELEGYYCWINELDGCVYAVKASTRVQRYCRSGRPAQWDIEITEVEVRWPIGPGPDLVSSYDDPQRFEGYVRDICDASCS